MLEGLLVANGRIDTLSPQSAIYLIHLLPAGAALPQPARHIPAQLAQLVQGQDESLVDLRPALNHLINTLR